MEMGWLLIFTPASALGPSFFSPEFSFDDVPLARVPAGEPVPDPSFSLLSEEDDEDDRGLLASFSSSEEDELPVALEAFGFRKKSRTITVGGRKGRRTMSTTSKTGWSFSSGVASVPVGLGSSMSSIIVVVSC
jgi:hypothetical protein